MPFPLADCVHQVLSPAGKPVAAVPDLPADQLLAMYRWMVYGRLYSDRMVALQRQGRIGTFGPLNGQEAASVGLAWPLQPADWLVGSYRELLSYMVKGVSPLALAETYRGYVGDGYPLDAHCLPYQIVLATQVLHAVGIAMGIQYDRRPDVVVGVCGDGATSEGDFNEALNFAGVYRAPIVFVVQNNGWAISVPRRQQTAAEYIAHRGPAFGLPGYVVDGNDVLAVYQMVKDAVARARAGDGPTLIEALTYRLGAHTTADDPKKYRLDDELGEWSARDPLPRFRAYLADQGLLDPTADERLHEAIGEELQGLVEALEAQPPQDAADLFDLVYAERTPQLNRQRADLLAELGRE